MRINPKETMKVFNARQELGFNPMVGVDEPTNNKTESKNKLLNDEDDKDEFGKPRWSQCIIANYSAKAGRNVANDIADVAGRMTNATTRTPMTTGKEISARRVQFKLVTTRPKTLLQELKALQQNKLIEDTKVAVETEEDEETTHKMATVDLAFDHSLELLCFMTEISSDPGFPKH